MAYKDRIKELRQHRKMSRNDLAKLLGLTPAMISNYENGKSSPPVDILMKLTRILGCDLNYLFQDDLEVAPITFTTSIKEQEVILQLRSLDKVDREAILDLISALYNKKKTFEEYLDDRMIDLPLLASTAYPENKKLKVVLGDSAEPLFKDGTVVIVEPAEAVNIDDIGIFQIEDRSVIRRFKGDHLEALNDSYEDIPINRRKKPKVIGKVIGKI